MFPSTVQCRFSARIGDREVVTRVKPRAEAREEYTLAVQQVRAQAQPQGTSGQTQPNAALTAVLVIAAPT